MDNTSLNTVQFMCDNMSQNTVHPVSDNTSQNTVQPMSDETSQNILQSVSDKTSGSLHRSNSCQRCAAVFMLPRSLTVHMQAVHGQTADSHTPAASKRHNVIPAGAKQTGSNLGRCSPQATEDHRDDFMMSADHFAIKLEPPWSMKEEPHDEPSAVYSTVQPMSDNTAGSLLSLYASHVCHRCFSTFVLFSSLELHMATFHGETLHDLLSTTSADRCYSGGYHHADRNENVGNCNNKKAVKGRKEKVEGGDSNKTDQVKKPRRHVCGVCSKAFTLPSDLKRHEFTHTGLKPFVCDVCNKAFSRAVHLKEHKRIHTGEKPYVCSDCGKGFTHSTNLKNHRLTHTGEKPHVCNVCWASFAEPNHLKQHKRIHTGEKPYVCTECGKGFALSGDLKRHYLMHTGEKPYTCPHCPAAFVQSRSLKRHLEKSHPTIQ